MDELDPKSLVIPLQDALSHLYDPLYSMPQTLCIALRHSAVTLPKVLTEAVHAMAPADTVPHDAPARRYHQLLHLRYIEGLTQEVTAERMGVSARYLRDLQRQSVEALATYLLQECRGPTPADMASGTSQVARELAALKQTAPRQTATLGSAVQSAMSLLDVLESMRGINVRLRDPADDLRIAMHPSALKQVILLCLEKMVRCMRAGEISVYAQEDSASPRDNVRIRLEAVPAPTAHTCDLAMVEEILAPHGGQVRVALQNDATVVDLLVPKAQPEQLLVLVIDDNDDLVSFYRAFVMGTAYEIAQVKEGGAVIPFVEARRPDLMVLDVMLPDVNGWELLVKLHGHPASSSIPVIVCSVIRDEEMARALGAVEYVPKPVGRQAFLSALDRAMATREPRASRL